VVLPLAMMKMMAMWLWSLKYYRWASLTVAWGCDDVSAGDAVLNLNLNWNGGGWKWAKGLTATARGRSSTV
jgi:hypothetical protein